jgi:hypothetical protein
VEVATTVPQPRWTGHRWRSSWSGLSDPPIPVMTPAVPPKRASHLAACSSHGVTEGAARQRSESKAAGSARYARRSHSARDRSPLFQRAGAWPRNESPTWRAGLDVNCYVLASDPAARLCLGRARSTRNYRRRDNLG